MPIDLTSWFSLFTNIGIGGVLAIWVWVEQQRAKVEREERIAAQKSNDLLRDNFQERLLKALNDAVTAIKESTTAQDSQARVIEGLKTLVERQHQP